MTELVDIINDNGEVIETLPRTEANKQNAKLRYVHVFVFNDIGQVLIQQRSEGRTRSNLIDPSVAGHVTSGDSYEQTAIKEAEEEIGVELNELTQIGEAVDYFGRCAVFTAKHNGPFKPNPDEVKGVYWINLEQLEMIMADMQFMAIDGMKSTVPLLLKYKKDFG